MLDNRYNEHPDYDASIFLEDRQIHDTFHAMGHTFLYLGPGIFYNNLDNSYKFDVYTTTDAAGMQQMIGLITSVVDGIMPATDSVHFEITLDMGDIFPIESWAYLKDETLVVTVERGLSEHRWTFVDPLSHMTRIGGYPSFGVEQDYGQPYAENSEGVLTPIPFLGQYILPDGRYVHAYHVNGCNAPYDESADDFEIPFEKIMALLLLSKANL